MEVLPGLGAALALMSAVWLLSLAVNDVSIVDVFWGLGFVALGWLYFWHGPGTGLRHWLVPVAVTIWGLRLALYILWRNWGRGEDYRYAAMREKRGESFRWLSLVIVFWLQGAIQWVVALPLYQVQRGTGPLALTGLDLAGLAVFAVGLLFESVGDFQLARFKADPAHQGQVMDRGLWRYTRHPNYFGDAMVWWGLTLVALATEGSWWVLISPVLMTVLLMKISGVALLEQGLTDTKPQYRDYVRRTSAFFPWLPKKT